MAFLRRNNDGESRTLFDMEDEHFYKKLEDVATAVYQSYQLQEIYTNDFLENLNLAALALLMEPRRINKKFRKSINNNIQNIMWWKDQPEEKQASFMSLLRNSVNFLLGAVMVLRPTVREHFLRSTGFPENLESQPLEDNRELEVVQ